MVRRSERISGNKTPNKLNETTKTILKSTRKRSHDGGIERKPKVKWLETNIEMDITQIDKIMMRKSALLTPASRKKSIGSVKPKLMPNFAEIHKLQFEKMESIKDNLSRKVERAIFLKTPTKDRATPVKYPLTTSKEGASIKKQLDTKIQSTIKKELVAVTNSKNSAIKSLQDVKDKRKMITKTPQIMKSPTDKLSVKKAKDVLKIPKKNYIFKGKVRTNRRFEVMMQLKKINKN